MRKVRRSRFHHTECDVVEEVLRIYGYNNVELPDRIVSSYDNTPNPDPESVRVKMCDLLAANGFMECMNNSLTKADYYNGLRTYPKENLPMVINPLSSDLNAMRQTLLFSGLEVIAHNLNRQAGDLRLFEMGNVYIVQRADASGYVYGRQGYSVLEKYCRCGTFFRLERICRVVAPAYGNGYQCP